MESNALYQSCLKMLNDKYKINEFSKDIFMSIYNNVYQKAGVNIPTNELNKAILIEIKNIIETKILNNDQQPTINDNRDNNQNNNRDEDLEFKIREMEALRASISKMNVVIQPPTIENDIPQTPIINNPQPIQIATYQQPIISNKFKTFIVNTTKNNFRLTPNIDVKFHSIYPCCICIPSDIKNKTPYLILVLSDGIKQISYTYIPVNTHNTTWDIWQPIINDYLDITLGNNNWIITLVDYLNNPIDLNEYQAIVNDVLMVNNNYTLNINKPHYFSINDKIKIIKNNGYISDNIIANVNNNIISINKNNLNLEDFIDSRIINYKHNISITFKYHLKQQE